MAYLVINPGLSPTRRRWLSKNAMPIASGVWLSNVLVPGSLCVRLGQEGLADMSEAVETAATRILEQAEEDIIRGHLRGRAIGLLEKRLKMVVDLSLVVDTITMAVSLLCNLGRGEIPEDGLDETEVLRDSPLGLDKDSVKKYLLTVAKKGPIH